MPFTPAGPSPTSFEDHYLIPAETIHRPGISIHAFIHHTEEPYAIFTTMAAPESPPLTEREPDLVVTMAQGGPSLTKEAGSSQQSTTPFFTAVEAEKPHYPGDLIPTLGGNDNVVRRAIATPSTLSTVQRAKRADGITELPPMQTEAAKCYGGLGISLGLTCVHAGESPSGLHVAFSLRFDEKS